MARTRRGRRGRRGRSGRPTYDQQQSIEDATTAPADATPAVNASENGAFDRAAPPDADSISPDEWPHRLVVPVVGERRPTYQSIIRQSALNEIHRHGSETDLEVCGVLVGNVYRDETGPYLYISDVIRGTQAAGRATQVTFTADTWTHIQTTMDQKFADDRIVGWYHTHPNFGIFLSGMDLFIQENFFNLSWQVALVYDPIGGDEGVFYWRKGRSDREPYLIEQDEPAVDVPRPPIAPALQLLPASPPEAPAAPAQRHPPLWLVAVTGFLTSFSVTYFLILFFARPPAQEPGAPAAATMPTTRQAVTPIARAATGPALSAAQGGKHGR